MKGVIKSSVVFTIWLDVAEGNLHQALQAQESQTGVDNQLQELARFTWDRREEKK